MRTATPLTTWLPVAAIVLVALFLVAPVLADPTGRISGVQGDPSAAVWQLSEFDTGHLGLVDPTTTPSANAPSGATLRRPIEVSTAIFDTVAFAVTKVTGAVLAYNLLLVVAVITNGLAMLFLARRLAFGAVAATIAALAFATAPVLLVELQLHVALAYAGTIPLVAAFGVDLVDRPSLRAGILAGAWTGVAAYVNPYLPLYTGVVLASCCLTALCVRRRDALVPTLVAVGSAGVLALPAAVLITSNHGEVVDATRRTLDELTTFALDAHAYVTAFGAWGWFVAIVGVAGCGFPWLRTRTRAWWAFAVMAVIGWLLTRPPEEHVAGAVLRMPSAWLFDLLPVWRVIGRASVLVWFVAALLLGAAAAWIAAQPRGAAVRIVGGVAVAVACAGWFAGVLDHGRPWFPSDTDPERTALLAASPGRVAEYPLWGFDNAIGPYLLRQMHHGHELLNGGIPATLSATIASVAANADDPQAVRALQVAGVTRIAADAGAPVPAGLRPVGRTSHGARVYDVPATSRAAIAAVEGAFAPETAPGAEPFQWVGDHGKLHVVSSIPGRYTVTFDVWAPNGATRALTVGDTPMGSIDSTPRTVAVCVDTLARSGAAERSVALRAGSASVRLGPDDPRRASLAVGGPQVHAGCATR